MSWINRAPSSSSSPKNISSTSSLLQILQTFGHFSPQTPMQGCLHFFILRWQGLLHGFRSHTSWHSIEHCLCEHFQAHFSMQGAHSSPHRLEHLLCMHVLLHLISHGGHSLEHGSPHKCEHTKGRWQGWLHLLCSLPWWHVEQVPAQWWPHSNCASHLTLQTMSLKSVTWHCTSTIWPQSKLLWTINTQLNDAGSTEQGISCLWPQTGTIFGTLVMQGPQSFPKWQIFRHLWFVSLQSNFRQRFWHLYSTCSWSTGWQAFWQTWPHFKRKLQGSMHPPVKKSRGLVQNGCIL